MLHVARQSSWLLRQYFGTLVYAVALTLIYSVMSQYFGYLGYSYFPYDLAGLGLVMAFASAPASLLPRRVTKFGDAALYVIYFIVVLPCSIIPYLQGKLQSQDQAIASAFLLTSCFMALVFAMRLRVTPLAWQFDTRQIFGAGIVIVQMLLIGYFFLRFGANINLADLDSIYEQRFAFSSALGGGLNRYLLAMLSSVLNPLVLAYGLHRRSLVMISAGGLGCMFAFATLAQRGEIITLFAVPLLYIAMRWRDGALFRSAPVLLALISLIGYLGFGLYQADVPFVQELYSFIFLRTLLISGTAYGVYAEFFATYPVTYFSASWPGRLFVDYPYEPFSIGQVVGQFLAGTNNAVEQWNFNANFLATDGIASLGLPGIPIAMLIAFAMFYIIRKFVDGKDPAFVVAAYVPFLMSITNTSFLTSMVTGGGAILAVMIWLSPTRSDK